MPPQKQKCRVPRTTLSVLLLLLCLLSVRASSATKLSGQLSGEGSEAEPTTLSLQSQVDLLQKRLEENEQKYREDLVRLENNLKDYQRKNTLCLSDLLRDPK